MIITFSGIDGSGKTTYARCAVDYLQEQGYNVCYIHLTKWTWVYAIGQLSLKKSHTIFDSGLKETRTDTRGGLLSLLVKGMRQIVLMIDLLRFWYFAFYHKFFHRRVLVCDRFFYDLGIQALYKKTISTAFAKIYWRLIPRATISILLDILPELAQQREKEHQSSYYQIKRNLYLEHSPVWEIQIIEVKGIDETWQDINQILDYHINPKNGKSCK